MEIFRTFALGKSSTPDREEVLKRRMRPATLSIVCRAWNRHVLSDPVLWTYIQVVDECEFFFSAFMERSKLLSVDLTVRAQFHRSREVTEFIGKMFKPSMNSAQFSKIRSLYLVAGRLATSSAWWTAC